MNGLIVIVTSLFDDFDYAVALYVAEVALAGEAPEVGACRCVVGSGIPEVFFFRDVLFVEDAFAPAVVDGQRVVGIAKAFEQVADDELVEVTPTDIRLRKKLLTELERRKYNNRNR